MNQQSARRATIILGAVMIVAMGASAILPLFTRNTSDIPTPEPTAAPTLTLPAQVTDFSAITFDQDYLHPSGLFSIAQPTGWTIGQQNTNANSVDVSMNNADLLSVVQTSLQINSSPIQSLDELDAVFTQSALNASWSNYRNPRETARVRGENQLTLDFELQNARQQTFLARQVSWWDTDWIYSVRVVVPVNQIDLLKYMIDELVKTFKPNRLFAGQAADWTAYFDQINHFVVRFPSTWTLTDSAPGRPASFSGPNASLRIDTQAISSALDEAAARKWVEGAVQGAQIATAQPVRRGEAAGFTVSYTYQDNDGNDNSGLAVLLNGANNTLYAANLRLFESGVDLNDDAAQVSHDELMRMLGSFNLLSDINVPLPTATPTPTLEPSATPTAAPTTEATPQSEASATPG
jgi:hypothetical protein